MDDKEAEIVALIRANSSLDAILSHLPPGHEDTCLSVATQIADSPELVEALFKRGASPNGKRSNGRAIFGACVVSNSLGYRYQRTLKMLDIFLKYGVDPNIPVMFGWFNNWKEVRPIVYLAICDNRKRSLKGERLLMADVGPVTKAEMAGIPPREWYVDCSKRIGNCLLAVRSTLRALKKRGNQDVFNKDVLKIIADLVWATRLSEEWKEEESF